MVTTVRKVVYPYPSRRDVVHVSHLTSDSVTVLLIVVLLLLLSYFHAQDVHARRTRTLREKRLPVLVVN